MQRLPISLLLLSSTGSERDDERDEQKEQLQSFSRGFPLDIALLATFKLLLPYDVCTAYPNSLNSIFGSADFPPPPTPPPLLPLPTAARMLSSNKPRW